MLTSTKFVAPPEWLSPTPVHAQERMFSDLATHRLPDLQRKLNRQMENPVPLRLFAAQKRGAAGLSIDAQIRSHLDVVAEDYAVAKRHTAALREEARKRPSKYEFSGVYVFIAERRPFYVGITRTVFRRVQAHVRNRSHHSASLLYSMVRYDAKHEGLRGELNIASERALAIQAWLQDQWVAILPVACPVERYVFELYASLELKTGAWNTFETH